MADVSHLGMGDDVEVANRLTKDVGVAAPLFQLLRCFADSSKVAQADALAMATTATHRGN